ncbi:WD40/YVTN/BNR-like repeat-containing protein [Kitasatospora sp. NBC_00315]|uniref:WD40/YVTN/BNR-like repeat-containing protein n=1 Tax=Kitasatospora sp. NBC_00315 TaxID=2975963 RepID=UPI00324F242D
MVDIAGAAGSPVVFPQFLDLAIREDASFPEVWSAAKDGTLWRHGGGPFPPQVAGQEPSPGGVTGLAVALDDGLWVVTAQRVLWRRGPEGMWSNIPVPNGIEPLVDVTVHKAAVWIVRDDGAIWRTADGRTFQEMSSLIPFKRLAGRNTGDLWGISFHPSANLFRQTSDGVWRPAEGGQDKSWADISVSVEGKVWLVATDGTVWTTTDGTGFLKVSGDGFSRISAARFDLPWAVKTDGTLWAWLPKPPTPQPPAPPTPPPPVTQPAQPPPSAVRPRVDVSTSGSGESTVFHLTGSGFIAGAEVTIRGTRVGADGVFNVYWTTRALPQGSIAIDLPVPCLSGISISFSANDGRRDPHDLTDRFWSNTVTSSCP